MGCYKYLYTLKGDKEALAEIEPRLLALQDSVLSYQVMGTLSQMQSLNERRKMQKRLDVAELQRSATIYALIFMTLVVIAIILVAVIIYRKNRKLTQMGRMLYNRVQELTSNAKTSSQRSDKNKQSLSQKLTDDEIKQIYEKIKSAFRDTELVCSPDFTLTKLAQIVDVQPRIASQVLSSITGLNFCSNVNRLRILEACRRFQGPEYERYSTDGIAKSVGFQSRSAFNSNFKKVTGLSVREYKALGKKNVEEISTEDEDSCALDES